MTLAMHFEICIARQKISKEPDAGLEGDEFAGKRQKLFLTSGQKFRCGRQITLYERLKHREWHMLPAAAQSLARAEYAVERTFRCQLDPDFAGS